MADFQTRFKLFPYRYSYTSPEIPERDHKTLYRQTNRNVLSHSAGNDVRLHDCQEPFMQDLRDKREWDCFILSHGLKATAEGVRAMHERQIKSSTNWQLRLLFHIGNEEANSGGGKAQFRYPRAVATRSNAQILVADASNDRIQVLNQFGVYVTSFGTSGDGDGQLRGPSGVSALSNDDAVVADSGNRRLQVFGGPDNAFKRSIAVDGEPFAVATDAYDNIAVATADRRVSVYRRSGELASSFPAWSSTKGRGPLYLCALAATSTVVASDSLERAIKTFTYGGRPLSTFTPSSPLEGVAVAPAGLFVERTGEVVVCDALNHSVNLYRVSDGALLAQLLGPQDGAGAVHACTVGPEGHLVVTEYATNGRHCCKIYRYRGCACHQFRPGSSKRPASKPAQP